MKALLLGATGFLGKRLALRLERDGVDYIPVSRSGGTDLRDPAQFERVLSRNPDVDVVLNAAAFIGGIKFGIEHPAEIYYNNSLMSTYLYELAYRYDIRRVVNPIANCSYPRDIRPEFKEELWWDGPLDDSVLVYGDVRRSSYVQSLAYNQQYGLETLNLIVPNMYGPGDHFDEERSHALGALVMKIARAHREHLPEVIVWGTGKPVREWLFVDDCVEAMLRATEVPYRQEPINIGVGEGVSIADLAKMICEEVGYRGSITFDTSRPDGAPHKVMNVTRCVEVFGWRPLTSLPEGLARTVQWYLDHPADRAGTGAQ